MYNILIVDDESIIRKGMKKFLDWQQYGFSVVGEAANGMEALAFAQQEKVDLIISDIRMPGMDGFELIEKLHENGLYPYVVMLSGYGEFEYARRAISLEAISYLLKPIQEEELIEVLERVRQKLDRDNADSTEDKTITDKVIRKMTPDRFPKKLVLEILHYMEKHLGEDLSLEQIAKEFLLSPNHVSYLLKSQLGAGFQSILIDMRIMKAQELLETQYVLKVFEIAGLVGYDDVQYFDRLFKKKVGVTPSEYRNSMK